MTRPLLLTRNYWKYGFSSRTAVEALLAGFGGLWLFVQLVDFFRFPLAEQIRERPSVFILVGLAYAAWRSRRALSVTNRVAGRDIHIELRIADIFDLQGAFVISTNTTFETDTSTGLIATDSIQGAFTTRHYDSPEHLQHELARKLQGLSHDEVTRSDRRLKRYPVGTTAMVEARGRTAYFVALTQLNDDGNAAATFEDLKTALPSLWEYVGSKGKLGTLLVPILGSGRARIPETREAITREIVQSFTAACAARRFCEKLVIVIAPADFREFDLDLAKLGAYISHICTYTEFKSAADQGTGVGIQ